MTHLASFGPIFIIDTFHHLVGRSLKHISSIDMSWYQFLKKKEESHLGFSLSLPSLPSLLPIVFPSSSLLFDVMLNCELRV